MALSVSSISNAFRAKVGRLPAILLVFLAVLALAGCYEVKEEVIPASLGEVLPYVSDRADFSDGGKIIFSRSSLNNDYRFRDIASDGGERLGTFRALRIKGNIYAVQARYDDEPGYNILFYAINRDDFQSTDVAEGPDPEEFAARFGVEYWGDELGGEGFSGDPGKILAMLRAMSGLEFTVDP